MESSGIEGIINRINQIEARFSPVQAQAQSAPTFQQLLSAVSPVASPVLRSLMPGGVSSHGFPSFQPPLGAFSPFAPFPQVTRPDAIVDYHGHPMTAATARAFSQLEALIAQRFPGRAVTITSTTDGRHVDPNHKEGKAIDFVVEGLTKEESLVLEQLTRQAGFLPYNEYLYSSPHKTGDHMHVDLAG